MRSRFAIIGALAAMLLALLYVAPAFAAQSWNRVGTDDDHLGVAVFDPNFIALGTGFEVVDGVPRVSTFDGDTFLGDDRSGADGGGEYTRVGNVTWVGAGPSTPWGDNEGAMPYSLVYVRVAETGLTINATSTVTLDVLNITTGQGLNDGDMRSTGTSDATQRLWNKKLFLSLDDGDGHAYFFVTKTRTELVGGHPSIVGNNGDVIRVTYGNFTRDLRVDAMGPSIGGTTPLHDTIQRGKTATFVGTITDSGSGLAPDVGGEDMGNGDLDGDGITADEPRTEGVNGKARDIEINMNDDDAPFLPADEVSLQASSGWTKVSDGFRFSLTRAGLIDTDDGTVHWNVVAADRVNNRTTTDADTTEEGNQNFTIWIDGSDPAMATAQAGVGYDAANETDKADASSIKVTFTAKGNPLTTAPNNADRLQGSSVDKADFRVEASAASTAELAIASITHPSPAAMQHVVYITLESPLAADARPEVNLIGTILDSSGRSAAPNKIEATEEIKPTLAALVTGPPGARPVVTGSATDKAILRVTSNEALTRTPDVYLLNFALNADGEVVVARADAQSGVSAVSGSSNTWEVQAQKAGLDGLTGVWVRGSDLAAPANTGMTGGVTVGDDGVPRDGDAVDLTKLAALFEFDDLLSLSESENMGFTLTPATTDGGNSTESSSPFVRINFAEGAEYNLEHVNGSTLSKDSVGFGTPPVNVEVDSHNAITLTKLTITDSAGVSTDLLGQEGVVDSDSFIIALSDLALGTYTLHVNGMDAAGNSLAQDYAYALHVVARSAFKVDLSPGFNLISVPGDPADPSLDAVLPSSHPATTVLAFAPDDPNGPWLTATRSAGMDWSDNASNTLSEIRAGSGYWVETGAFTPLSTLINERSAAAVPPTYGVLAGWNLLGVTDVTLQKAGTEVSVDTYLASTPWSVAYTFDTQSNKWTKHSKGGDSTAKIGQGMWVYMSADGALAP